MKNKKKVAALAAAGILGVAGVLYGASYQKLSVVSHIMVGDVNISLKEYEKQGNKEILYRNARTVLPGTEVSKIPRIINQAMPCWIRARVFFENDKKNVEGLSDENLEGITEKWVKRGDYYYYTQVLKEGESADLFQKVKIPFEWEEEHVEQKLKIEIQAEAIQAANFTPNFRAMSPWENQKIQKCVHEKNGNLVKPKDKAKLAVEFRGKAHELISVPGDFFENFGEVMPGDRLEDVITVSNTTDRDSEIWFQTDTNGRNKEKLSLLKEIKLKIYLEGRLMYKGTLNSSQLGKKKHSLGVYKKGQKRKLKFVLEIPKEWDNSKALKQTDITWIFAVEEEQETDGIGGESARDGQTHRAAAEKTAGFTKKDSVKTGDTSPVEIFLVLLLVSGGMIWMIRMKKGGTKK